MPNTFVNGTLADATEVNANFDALETGPTGPAGGDFTGSYPNPTIAPGAVGTTQLQDGAIGFVDWSFNDCTAGEVPKWSRIDWQCATEDSASYPAGNGLELSGSEFRITQSCGPEVYFSVKRDAAYTWATDCSVAVVDFSSNSTVWTNQGGGLSGDTFTAPASGTYSLHGSVRVSGLDLTAGSTAYVFMNVAGKNYESDMFTSPVWSRQRVTPSVSVTVHMNAGQTAKLWAYTCNQGGGANASIYGNSSTTYAFTHFTGARVF